MLQALSILDFAIIDRVDIEFGAGLTIVTGETGAGKSILINALKLVLGGRARTEVVRAGADRAVVEALFDLRDAAAVKERLEEAGIEAGDELVVRRVIAANKRHRVYLNGTLATLKMLQRVTEGLVDISGQHEHYSLLRPEFHMVLLDRVGGLLPVRLEVELAHRAVADLDAQIADLSSRQRDRAERESFLQFQLQELLDAALEDPDEERGLEQEADRLRNVERLRGAASSAEEQLYSAGGSAVERLGVALREVESLVEIEPEMSPILEDLNTALALAEDSARSLADYERGLAADPQRLDEIESRLSLFARLRRKYGASLPEVISRRDEMQSELAALAGSEDALAGLATGREAAAVVLLGAGQKLTAARKAAGARLVKAVQCELKDLGMGGATLFTRLTPLSSGVAVAGGFVGPRGADRVEFLMSANPGETPQPLNRIASGGELSRFMLAVKQVIAESDPVGTYVFDEVDTGVGGPTAEAIGYKLRAVSRRRQALCITHLPQIAALGDHHLHVSKAVEDNRTRSRVTLLSREGRVTELSRMLGGANITLTTRAHAEELLAHALSN